MKSKRSVLVNERGDLENEREEGGGWGDNKSFIIYSDVTYVELLRAET